MRTTIDPRSLGGPLSWALALLCVASASPVAAGTPEAEDDYLSTFRNQTLHFAIDTLLANDRYEGEVVFELVESTRFGVLSCIETVCTYEPYADETGLDSFRYAIREIGSPWAQAVADVELRILLPILPIAGDWDGDGLGDLGWYNATTGDLFFLDVAYPASPSEPPYVDRERCTHVALGAGAGWLPIAGDWNGDKRDEFGLFDPATRTFRLFVLDLDQWTLHETYQPPGGGVGGLPVAGDWNADSRDEAGVSLGLGEGRDAGGATFELHTLTDAGVVIAQHELLAVPEGDWWPVAAHWGGGGSLESITGIWDPDARMLLLGKGNRTGPTAMPASYSHEPQGQLPITGNWGFGESIGFFDLAGGSERVPGTFVLYPCDFDTSGTCVVPLVNLGGNVILLPPPQDPTHGHCPTSSIAR